MIGEDTLEKHGLFGAKVPRYTSYPPANLFEASTGRKVQLDWLHNVRPGEAVSIYIHVPFCRRLCWFCACRTQGTKTMRPVDSYVTTLTDEIAAVRAQLPEGVSIARLHLGGGTPTLLTPTLMNRLLDSVFEHFEVEPDMEFSVEIDPTEAAAGLMATLSHRGMNRASIGVQDFAPRVQAAIGREQSLSDTRAVIDLLRDLGVRSLNLDLLYGLPHQTLDSLRGTLARVVEIAPDRLALYGYAHVPNVSRRQVMIDNTALPGPHARHHMAQMAHDTLTSEGYLPLGIDHFALPDDSLAIASASHRMHRNFQGYTDDRCETLLGFGASAISQFREGFAQNAVATAAYAERIGQSGLAGHRGLVLTPQHRLIGEMIEQLMCYGEVSLDGLPEAPGLDPAQILRETRARFDDVATFDGSQFTLLPEAKSLTRVIAAAMDNHERDADRHSAAI